MNRKNKLRYDYKEEPQQEDLQKLKTNKSIFLISETDPNHAYGPNYYMLPHDLKTYYKYIRMRKFVHVQIEDEREIIKFNYLFYFSVAASVFSTFLFTKGINSLLIKRFSKKAFKHINNSPVMYSGVPASLAGSLTYGYLNVYFIKYYCGDFLTKYQEEAITNGFDDYEISEDKGKHSWTNYYRFFKL